MNKKRFIYLKRDKGSMAVKQYETEMFLWVICQLPPTIWTCMMSLSPVAFIKSNVNLLKEMP